MRSVKVVEKKLKSLTWFKKKAWAPFSKFIRKRDDGICFTCEKKVFGKGYHAGHFIPGAICGKSLYFSEVNVHGQCYYCNINLGGNGAIYAIKMQQKYGKDILEKLNAERIGHKGEQWKREELVNLKYYYEEKNK